MKKNFNEKEHSFFMERLKSRFPRDSSKLEPIRREVNRIQSESAQAPMEVWNTKYKSDVQNTPSYALPDVIPKKIKDKGAGLDEASLRYIRSISVWDWWY